MYLRVFRNWPADARFRIRLGAVRHDARIRLQELVIVAIFTMAIR